MKLTASQIRHLDELNMDKWANKQAFSTAMNLHQNRISELRKAENAMWEDWMKDYDLDPDKDWTIEEFEGSLLIVEKTD